MRRQNMARLVSMVRSLWSFSGAIRSLRISQRLNSVSIPRQMIIAITA